MSQPGHGVLAKSVSGKMKEKYCLSVARQTEQRGLALSSEDIFGNLGKDDYFCITSSVINLYNIK